MLAVATLVVARAAASSAVSATSLSLAAVAFLIFFNRRCFTSTLTAFSSFTSCRRSRTFAARASWRAEARMRSRIGAVPPVPVAGLPCVAAGTAPHVHVAGPTFVTVVGTRFRADLFDSLEAPDVDAGRSTGASGVLLDPSVAAAVVNVDVGPVIVVTGWSVDALADVVVADVGLALHLVPPVAAATIAVAVDDASTSIAITSAPVADVDSAPDVVGLAPDLVPRVAATTIAVASMSIAITSAPEADAV